MSIDLSLLADDPSVTLYFEVRAGEFLDLEIAAAAAIHWSQAMRAAALAIDPEAQVRVAMLGAQPGSMKWLAAVEHKLDRLHTGFGRYPRLTQLALGLAIFIPTVAIPTYDFYFGEKGLPQEDRDRIDQIIEKAANSPEVETPRRQMFNAMSREPKITGAGVSLTVEGSPAVVVPSNQFPERGGLFLPQEPPEAERTVYPTLEVELISPHLSDGVRAWTFRQEGMPPFTATMRDARFLAALERSEIRETLRAHIPMVIKLKVVEVLRNGQWVVKAKGRSVVEVLSPSIS